MRTSGDKDKVFWGKTFKDWCRSKGIKPRYGAVGKHGSIAVVERAIRTLKNECTRRILLPLFVSVTGHGTGPKSSNILES